MTPRRRHAAQRTTGPARLLLAMLLLAPLPAYSAWNVIQHDDAAGAAATEMATTRNEAGYTLEIYRDTADAVRARLTLPGPLLSFADGVCPTYQIDRGAAVNRSVHDALCLAGPDWSEFVLGYVADGHVASSSLLAIMNGITIVFRFKLENGDYRRTEFSLQGSKRALSSALGEDISIGAR